MSCAIHNFGASVLIDRGVRILNESTKQASTSSERLEGTITNIDRANHKITVRVAGIGTVTVDAHDVKTK